MYPLLHFAVCCLYHYNHYNAHDDVFKQRVIDFENSE